MNQKQIFDELNTIAAEIEPMEAPWRDAWSRLDRLTQQSPAKSSSDAVKEIERTTKELNDFIATKVEQIARITNNSVSSIRMGFAPREGLDVWFYGRPGVAGGTEMSASWFLRKVAEHKSFNTNYWASREREIEREAFLAKVDPSAPVVGPVQAAEAMKAGLVPNISARDLPDRMSGISPLQAAMRDIGLLTQYDKNYADRLSTTQSVAFVVVGGPEDKALVYWTKGVAWSRREMVQLEEVEVEQAGGEREARPRGQA